MASTCPILLSCLILGVLARAADVTPDPPDTSWRAGPIRYILVVKEDRDYKALKTDAERAAFIETFWAALDPTPGTPENERRAEFWDRVETAGRLFREGLVPGWKTDRGKFYVLLGPPDEREQQGAFEVWKYVALPNPEADPEVMIRFRRNSEGEFHVGLTTLEYWDPSQESDGPAAGDTFLGVRTKSGTLEMMKGRFRMAGFPRATVQTGFATAPLQYRLRYDFRRAKRDSTRVVVTLALDREQFRAAGGGLQTPDVTLSVAVDEAKSGKPVGSFSTPMRPAGSASMATDGPLLLQGSFTIEPGTYKTLTNIVDGTSHRGATRSETIEAPDFGRGLTLSSVALGRLRDEPQVDDQGAGSGSTESGGPALIPEPDSSFRPGDTILLAYEVYNAGEVKPDLDVQYEFFFVTGGGPLRVGQAILLRHQSSRSLAYSLPLRGWPGGTYRVRILVKDDRSGHQVERQMDFRVDAAASD